MGNLPEDQVIVAEQRAVRDTAAHSAEAVQFDVLHAELQQLIEMLAHENTLLRNHNVPAVAELHNDKLRLIRRIELRKELMRRHPEHIIAWTMDEKQELASLQHVLEEHLMENVRRTEVAQRINRKVVDCVVRTLEERKGHSNGYNKVGQISADTLGSYNLEATQALAINESI